MRNRRRKNDRAGAAREIGGGVADGLVARHSFEEELSGLPVYRLGDHAGGGSVATGGLAVAWSFREVRDLCEFWSGAHAVEFGYTVFAPYRGRGVGGALLEAAMGAIRAELPIRLDATPLGRPLYQRHGFEDEATLTRYALTAPPGPRHERGNPDQAAHAQRLTASDLKIVIEHDKETGRTRGPLLEWAFDRLGLRGGHEAAPRGGPGGELRLTRRRSSSPLVRWSPRRLSRTFRRPF